MADVKISAAADIGTVVATDKVPVARSASTTAYAATMAELASYANGAYVPSYFGGSPSMDGTAAPGTSALVGRGDHVHPTDTSRYAASNPSGYQTAAQVATAVAPYANDVGRNLIHNPLFNVAQRGAGPFNGSGYAADRWLQAVNLDTTQSTLTDYGDPNRAAVGDESAQQCIAVNVAANAGAASFSILAQFIENVRRLGNKTVTVSFWAHATTGTPRVGVGFRQYFGTGGSPSALVDLNATPVTLSTTPARYTVTTALPSTSGKTLGTNNDHYTRLALWLSCGATNNTLAGGIGVQSGTFLFWGVQLEVSSVATPLEHIDPGLDLRNCQRFFQTGTVNQSSGCTTWQATWTNNHGGLFPVPMRATPTIALIGTPSQINCTGTTVTSASGTAYVHQYQITATGSGVASSANFSASAEL